MKRCFSFILLLILLITVCGCDSNQSNLRTPVNFYYRTQTVDYRSESGVISVEVRNARGHADDHQYLLEQYLNGARSSNCTSPFPAGTTLKEFNVNETHATVMLSPHLTLLTGSELMIACVCLARTIFDMTGVQSVQISAQNSLINDQPYITITENSFILWDTYTDLPA